MTPFEIFELQREMYRAIRIARELGSIVRRDASLAKRMKPTTKRWLAKQDKLQKEEEAYQDEIIRQTALRFKALAKLSKVEKDLLGIPYDDDNEEEKAGYK